MLLSEITIAEWLTVKDGITFEVDNTQKQEVLTQVLTNLYFKNLARSFRRPLEAHWKSIGKAYLISNRQKLEYLLETAYKEFITEEASTTTEGVGLDYNVDYYGGEGQTGKDTSTTTNTSTAKNNKDKLRSYRPIAKNVFFKEFINILFDTWAGVSEW